MALMRAAALAFALVLNACATSEREDTAATAMAPLIGCWRGEFEGNADIHDERCFEQLPGGRDVRDTHFVRPTTYGGQSDYASDSASDALVFTYRASDGGVARGTFHAEPGALVFDAYSYVGADGSSLRMRARWVIENADRYVATTEVEEGGVWRLWGRITFVRSH